MPSYTSIINALLRILPGDQRKATLKSVARLHPHSENLAVPATANLQLDEHTRAWQNRHTFETCRGWKMPFWLNAQTNPESPAYAGAPIGPVLSNIRARDAAALPGLAGVFAGTMDRRGMITPVGGHFSIEAWFRFGDEIIHPAEIFAEDTMKFQATNTTLAFSHETGHELISITVAARGSEDFQFLEVTASCDSPGETPPRPLTIYLAIRPYTLEGMTPLHDLVYNSKGFWMSDSRVIAWFAMRPSEAWASDARHGDAAFFLSHPPERTAVRCGAGLANAVNAFHFNTEFSGPREVTAVIPLEPANPRVFPFAELVERNAGTSRSTIFDTAPLPQAITISGNSWGKLLETSNHQLVSLTDIRSRELHDQFLHDNHWLAPAVRALLYQGHNDQAARLLTFPALGVQKNGYLDSAGGKWGFQGQFLTALADYFRHSPSAAIDSILSYPQIRTIGRWIMRKRREIAHAPAKPTGLLPPGITRSGVGMEYQLADNFWALEGLESAAWLARLFGEHTDAEMFKKDAARYAGQINGAIHRELEYGLSQQVPARLHRAFDPAGAAELLEIALIPEAHRLLRANDWLTRLIDKLIEPLNQSTDAGIATGIPLRQIDQQGIYPARRMMLCLAMLSTCHSRFPELFTELESLSTPFHIWTECIDPRTRMGTGQAFIDPEAAALYTVLLRAMVLQESDHNLLLTPAMPEVLTTAGAEITLKNTATIYGPISASVQFETEEISMEFESAISDPSIELTWCQPDPGSRVTYPCNTPAHLGVARQASGHHTYKFPQPSNNTTS